MSELVEVAAGGEPVLITVRGRPKARLVAANLPETPLDMAGWVDELSVLQHRHSSLLPQESSVLDDLREDRW